MNVQAIVEVGKFYRTRGGHKVRIYSISNGFIFPIHGAVRIKKGEWAIQSWNADGAATSSFTVSGRSFPQKDFDIDGDWVPGWTPNHDVPWRKN